jgi:hypothetical protein
MKLEIELDLNKIDYDSINQQIQQKIANLNLTEVYRIDHCIRKEIDEQVSDIVRRNMYSNYWGGTVDAKMNTAITTEFKELLRETIAPAITEAFDKIPDEEVLKMFIEVFPIIYMSEMTRMIQDNYYTEKANSETFINGIITSRLQNYIRI